MRTTQASPSHTGWTLAVTQLCFAPLSPRMTQSAATWPGLTEKETARKASTAQHWMRTRLAMCPLPPLLHGGFLGTDMRVPTTVRRFSPSCCPALLSVLALRIWPGVVVPTCNPSYLGGRGSKIKSSRPPQAKLVRPCLNNKI
jgi:hypothetical protein